MSIDKEPDASLKKERLEICTLGRFLVKSGDRLISEQSNRSYRVWDLFKYLITHRDRGILPEVILENLWPGQEFSDPKRALRTPIYRLRRLLEPAGCHNGNNNFISFSQGCYKWDAKAEFSLDAQEFEELCRRGQMLAENNPTAAIEAFQKAVSLYKGDYLPECLYHEWALPVRNYYRRLFLQSSLDLCRLLKNTDRNSEIIKVCETVFHIEPFEEEFHLRFLEAQITMAKIKEARSHYEYVTSLFYRELGIKPSPAMRDIYRQLKTGSEYVEFDLTSIQESLAERIKTEGGFFCDPDIFRHLYKLEKRRLERTGQVVFLGLLSLTTAEYRTPPQKALKEASDILLNLLTASLRKGDIITHWNESQTLILLPGLNLEQGEKVLQRITSAFNQKNNSSIKLHGKLQPVIPPN
jgi:DNA-binding SARP family transcriptional activator